MGASVGISVREFEILRDVLVAATSAHARRGLTYQLSESLTKHLPIRTFELGWCEDTACSTAIVNVFVKGPDIGESIRDLRGSETLRILRDAKAGFEATTSPDRTLVIPLVNSESPPGYARLLFGATSDETFPTEPVVELLRRILTLAQHHCRLVERVAKLSSTAHQESQDLRQQLQKYTDVDRIVARSGSMRRVLESADLVAHHDTAVLLRGESGTGKELLARRIHRLSRRSRYPFIAVNCGALPETLLESELFGHERGAFTGAIGRHRGRFERANNGTIFLDEVAELPPSAQVKLLRVLQEGDFERLGGEETIRVNV